MKIGSFVKAIGNTCIMKIIDIENDTYLCEFNCPTDNQIKTQWFLKNHLSIVV
jgi:hypothetical protein